MPSQLQKSLQEYISKRIKKPATPQLNLQSKTFSTSTSWILRGCKHPRTPSFSDDRGPHNDDAATLSDIDRFLQENFKTLYQGEFDDHIHDHRVNINDIDEIKDHKGEIINEGKFSFDSSPRRYKDLVRPMDLCGSRRFFIGDVGSSRSLMEDSRASLMTRTSTSEATALAPSTSKSTSDDHDQLAVSPDDFIAILTYSPSPYSDFRNSMQEMIKARQRHNGKVNWEFMEELLFCYLNLNDKKSYKYILKAFVDLIVVLRENSGRLPSSSRTKIDSRSSNKREDVT